MCTIMSPANNDIFTSSSPTWMTFTSFSCVMDVARTSSTMLNESGESRHSYLVPDLKGKVFSFCPLSIMLVVGFSYMAFIMLRYAPSIPTLLSVFLDFIKCFFSVYWYDHVVLVLHFVYVIYSVYWFVNIVSSLHPWDESHLIVMCDLFHVLLNPDCQYFVEDFNTYVHQRYWTTSRLGLQVSIVLLVYNFLSLYCLYLILELEQYWPYKRSLESSLFLNFLE